MKLNAAHRLLATSLFKYALVNRPFGIGTCPKEGVVGTDNRPAKGHDHYDMARHGIVIYDRKLTDQETKNFELAFIADGHDRLEIAHDVAETMKRYAKPYLEMYTGSADDRDDFVKNVSQKLKSSAKGYPPSVGNIGEFADLVALRLEEF